MRWKEAPVELSCWTVALVLLAFTVPGNSHFTLCPLAWLGFSWCPGCGLGHSVSSLLQGDFRESWHYHWFGIPATAILLHRILILSKKYINSQHIIS